MLLPSSNWISLVTKLLSLSKFMNSLPMNFNGVDVWFGWMLPSVDKDYWLIYQEKDLKLVLMM